MRIAVLIASRNRPDLVDAMVERLERSMTLPYDLFVVECGTDREKLSSHSTLWYADPDFRGKCYGHNLALEAANLQGRYDYYWVLMNDVVFDDGVDPGRLLVETMEANARMAILSPTNVKGEYLGAEPRPGGGWRKVTTCDYLGFMMRGAALRDVGFLDPGYRYCWGAIHELSYKLYREGWFVAYSDDVSYRHLGGTTYGAAGTATISREEYQRRARLYAYDHLRATYGDNWDEVFWAACAGHEIEIDTFSRHKAVWERDLSDSERAERVTSGERADVPLEKRMLPEDRAGAVRLHLGCGPEYREGWINVDTNPDSRADVVSTVESLPMFTDGAVDVIEACHLFEHLPHHEAVASLAEWSRVLRPGGELFLEMPDLEACIRIMGEHSDENGFDLGLIGLYGWPPAIEKEGAPQIHKWGWSRPALAQALREAGFDTVEFGPITQTWRVAAKTGRDFRVRAVKAAPVAASDEAPRAEAPAIEPWPLATDAPWRVFAWPRYDDVAELEQLFDVFGRPLVGRSDACLCLRRDPVTNASSAVVLEALTRAHERVLGKDAALEILLIEEPLEPDDWARLGRSVNCVAHLPSSARKPRVGLLERLQVPAVRRASELRAALPSPNAAEGPAAEPAPAAEDPLASELAAEIRALHPWFYPVTIGNLRVRPGVGTHLEPEYLEHRTSCRATLLVDEVTRRVDFQGKRLLDLACNCAWWSAHYARRGAESIVGVDGRELHCRQAELLWSRNRILPEGSYRFFQGNIAAPETWEELRAAGPYDVTLCAGILYHVPNYRDVLRWAADVTREVLIVDTRVGDAAEEVIEEPGDLHFNAIAETRAKVVPNLEKLLAALRDLGFDAETLPVGFPAGLGVNDVDNYAAGRRVTILARKVAVPDDRPRLHALPAVAPQAPAQDELVLPASIGDLRAQRSG